MMYHMFPAGGEFMNNMNEYDDMDEFDEVQERNTESSAKLRAVHSWQDFCEVMKTVGSWCYKLRSVLLAIPVVVASISLAIRNMAKLPDQVGLNLLASGEYQFMVGKSVAVLGPLAVTAVCLLMMFSSRKVIYPWLISVFSLVLPYLIWITNVFPA